MRRPGIIGADAAAGSLLLLLAHLPGLVHFVLGHPFKLREPVPDIAAICVIVLHNSLLQIGGVSSGLALDGTKGM